MKKLFLLSVLLVAVLLCSASAKPTLPSFSGFVNDHANLLSKTSKAQLENKLVLIKKSTGKEIAVLIVKTLDGESIEDFGHDVFNKWGVGQKDKDDGALLTIALDEHKIKIDVGYGLEKDLTDLECGRIVGKNGPIAELFRKEKYAEGIDAGIEAIMKAIGGEYASNPDDESDETVQWFNSLSTTGKVIVIIILFILVGIAIIGVAAGASGDGGWSSGGGSDSGGGGFSFGGGSCGGGGASGGW